MKLKKGIAFALAAVLSFSSLCTVYAQEIEDTVSVRTESDSIAENIESACDITVGDDADSEESVDYTEESSGDDTEAAEETAESAVTDDTEAEGVNDSYITIELEQSSYNLQTGESVTVEPVAMYYSSECPEGMVVENVDYSIEVYGYYCESSDTWYAAEDLNLLYNKSGTLTLAAVSALNVPVTAYVNLRGTTDDGESWSDIYGITVEISGNMELNGVIKADDGNWYYYVDGVVQTDYNGFQTNKNGDWYIENGQVTFTKNSVIKDSEGTIGTKGTWYYVTGSKVRHDFTGLANYSNANGWWYIKNGKVDFTANTVAKNKNGWYYVTGGKVQFGFTGLANYSNANGWWYIKNGKVDFTANTVAKNKNGWWYVTGGKVQFGYTGLADYSNANGWWYIKNGKVDFTFNGIGTNKNGQWYIQNGKVIFSYNGKEVYDGKLYILKNGKATKVYGFAWPLPGNTTITSKYGYRICPFHGYEFHGGIDIAAMKGTSILACADGTVSATGYNSSKGRYIEIDHGNGVKTTYWHCNSIKVKTGQTVVAGDVIGSVGMTGSATGYHLDLRFYIDGETVSPLTLVTPE